MQTARPLPSLAPFVLALLACAPACNGTSDPHDASPDVAFDATVEAATDAAIAPTDSGVTSAQCAAAVDLNAMGTLQGETTTIQGSTDTPTTVMAAPCNPTVTGQNVFRYHVRGDNVWLRATTAIPGGTDYLDTVLWALVGPCSENATVLACNDDDFNTDNGLDGRSTLLTRSLSRGTEIDFVVGAYSDAHRGAQSRGSYSLGVTESPSAAAGAMCDSSIPGGCVAGYECAATSLTTGLCVQPGMEHEPNDTPSTAEAPRALTQPIAVHAALDPGGDVDCFGLTVPQGANLYLEASDGGGGCPAELRLDLYRMGQSAPLESDEDAGRAAQYACPRIYPEQNAGVRAMNAGTYEVCVSIDSATPTLVVPAYSLQAALVN